MEIERFVIVSAGVWAQGKTLEGAKRAFRQSGGKMAVGYTIYTFHKGTEFVGVGQEPNPRRTVHWKGEVAPDIKIVDPRPSTLR